MTTFNDSKRLKITVYLVLFCSVILASPVSANVGYVVDQRGKQFIYKKKIINKISVKVGDYIYFRNFDPYHHTIYSLSKVKQFDLGPYPAGQSRTVNLTKAGTLLIKCAIHPNMYLDVQVSE